MNASFAAVLCRLLTGAGGFLKRIIRLATRAWWFAHDAIRANRLAAACAGAGKTLPPPAVAPQQAVTVAAPVDATTLQRKLLFGGMERFAFPEIQGRRKQLVVKD